MISSLPSFHDILCDAIREAILSGVSNRDEMVKMVVPAVLPYDTAKDNFLGVCEVETEQLWKMEQELAPRIAGSTRGTWALLHYVHKGRQYWKPMMSDGTGQVISTGQLNSFHFKPLFMVVHLDLVSAEIYRAWAQVAEAVTIEKARALIQDHDIHKGSTLWNVSVPGYLPFSKVVVDDVDLEHGSLAIVGNYRGSARRYQMTVPAALIQIAGKA